MSTHEEPSSAENAGLERELEELRRRHEAVIGKLLHYRDRLIRRKGGILASEIESLFNHVLSGEEEPEDESPAVEDQAVS